MAFIQRARFLPLQALRAMSLRTRPGAIDAQLVGHRHWQFATLGPCRPLSAAANANTNTTRFRRRKRPKLGKGKVEGNGPPRRMPEIKGLTVPYSFGGENGESSEEYFKKVTLSPWVPIPDPIARKLFDMSAAGSEDVSLLHYS